ncbi:hypothetical protein CCYA_CCYA04G1315 [Cyanidiococcus yangmingshanensis]|nr:hypothetical protein CCYA_CCYA04G1315 [Cyanidiococcus yangmingshanensis]
MRAHVSPKSSAEAHVAREEVTTSEANPMTELQQQVETLVRDKQRLSEELTQTQAQLAAALMRVEAATRVIERLLKERKVPVPEQPDTEGP